MTFPSQVWDGLGRSQSRGDPLPSHRIRQEREAIVEELIATQTYVLGLGGAGGPHTHVAADITDGTLAATRLGSGTADSTKYLRGDQTWQVFAHTHDAADIASGTVATARLGSGVADVAKYLRGDQTWQAFAHTHVAADITDGTLATARLGSGAADNTTFLRGDQTWQTVTPGPHTHAASDIDSGIMATARLGSGTADATAYLRGDQTWQAFAHTHVAADITDGTLAAARLGSGTADSTKYLRGDQTWQVFAHAHDAADIASGTVATARLGSGTASSSTFLRGDQTWQPAGGGASDGFETIVSSADEDVTNAQNTNHSQFQFAVTAGKRYMVDMLIYASGNNATGDYEARLSVAAGTMKGRGHCQSLTAADAIQNLLVSAAAAATTANLVCGTTADLEVGTAIRLLFVFVPDTTTTLNFQFGNGAAAAGRISRTGKGSVMKWKLMN